jgi:hypothetical protein
MPVPQQLLQSSSCAVTNGKALFCAVYILARPCYRLHNFFIIARYYSSRKGWLHMIGMLEHERTGLRGVFKGYGAEDISPGKNEK